MNNATQAVPRRKQVEGLVDLGQGQLVRDVFVHFDLLHGSKLKVFFKVSDIGNTCVVLSGVTCLLQDFASFCVLLRSPAVKKSCPKHEQAVLVQTSSLYSSQQDHALIGTHL